MDSITNIISKQIFDFGRFKVFKLKLTFFSKHFNLSRAGSGYIRMANFASSANGENMCHSKYHQLGKCVVRRRSVRVQGYIACLLTKRYACCLLCSDQRGGRYSVPLRGYCVQKLSTVRQTRISTTQLVGRGTGYELVVHFKLIVSFFHCQYRYKSITKIRFTKKINTVQSQ